jgi:glycopeptide antibiotics resistance protein
MTQFLKSFLLTNLIIIPLWIIMRLLAQRNSKPTDSAFMRRELILLFFVIYVVSVASITIIPLPEFKGNVSIYRHINLVPFARSVKSLANLSNNTQASVTLITISENFFGNIIMFIPLGIFLPLLNNKYHSFKKVILTAALCSLSIESIQFISMSFGIYRFVDIDDVILNTFGATIGFALYKRFVRRLSYSFAQ